MDPKDFAHFPEGFGQWGTCMAFFIASLLWAANQGIKLLKSWRGTPPHPPNELLEASAAELLRRISEIERKAEDERKAGATSRAMIYRKIDETRDQLSDGTAELRHEMSAKFEELPEKIIRLIKALRHED